MRKFTERVHFRVINMACCHIVLCTVNSRWYMYCPECGKKVYPDIKQWVVTDCYEAYLKFEEVAV